MKIPLKKVECRKISYGGIETRVVGSISQTVQVVYDGVPSGTMHLKAKVIRHLTTLYGVDCIAGKKLYRSLASSDCKSESSVVNSHDGEEEIAENSVDVKEETYEQSFDNKASDEDEDDLIFDADDSPKTRMKKRRQRFMVANISFTSTMKSSPEPSPKRASTPKHQETL